MSTDRAAIDSLQPMLRNVPLRPRQWRDMMNRDDVVSISSETVELALVPRDGQLHLYYAFSSAEEARSDFLEVFNELADDIEEEGWPYTRIDLVELGTLTFERPDEARRLLTETQRAVEEWLQMPSNTWMRRAEIELLRREAEALIEPNETHDAVKRQSSISDEPER